MSTWYPILNESEYRTAIARFEEIYTVTRDDPDYREMQLLALLINEYEKKQGDLPDVDPVEMIKIRMKEFSLSAADLARVYGDKGTVSKVLNYKQPLSLTMIRKFSNLLRLPADVLTREYVLHNR